MQEKISELRRKISPIINRTRGFLKTECNKPEMNFLALEYVNAGEKELCLAFSWLGETLGCLNVSTPYVKGNDVTHNKVEPTNDWVEFTNTSAQDRTQEIKEIRASIKDVRDDLKYIKEKSKDLAEGSDLDLPDYFHTLEKCNDCLIQAKNILGFTFPFIGEVVK